MQTFLPYPNFTVSAMCLDRLRLGNQRVECRQLQTAIQTVRNAVGEYGVLTQQQWSEVRRDAITVLGKVGWVTHPCVDMWCNHTVALMAYGDCCIREWVRRGYKNTMPLMLTRDAQAIPLTDYDLPSWVGDPNFHASHRSNLLRKDQDHYGQFGWTEPTDMEYVWPES